MPRYFFNMVQGADGSIVRDREGMMLAGVPAARREAVGLARDVVRHRLNGLAQTWQVVVTDDGGKEVLSVPFSEIRVSRLSALTELARRIATLVRGSTPRAPVSFLLPLLFVLLAAVATGTSMEPGGSFRPAAAPTQGTVIAIRFAPQASAAEITQLLLVYDASLVSGPGTGGLYRLRLSEAVLSPDELAALVGRIGEERVVDFVAPVH